MKLINAAWKLNESFLAACAAVKIVAALPVRSMFFLAACAAVKIGWRETLSLQLFLAACAAVKFSDS